MPNTKITGAKLKNHFSYRIWVYVLIIAAGYFAADLIYTMTEYRPPAERKVEFQLVQAGIVETESMAPVCEKALELGKEYDPTLELVDFISLSYSGNPETDMYGVQKYVVMIAAKEGDIWVLSEDLFLSLYLEGAAIPLDEYIDQGLIPLSQEDRDRFTLYEPTGETTEDGAYIVPTSGEKRTYAIPAELMPGIAQYGFDPTGKCAVIMSYSKNPDTCAKVLGSVISILSEEAK